MKNWLKDNLHFTSRERNGMLALLVSCIFFLGIPRYYQLFWHPEPPDYQKFERLLQQWAVNQGDFSPLPVSSGENEANRSAGRGKKNISLGRQEVEQTAVAQVRDSVSLFNFDPNQAEETELLRLGFAPGVVRNLIKYREKGGVFRKKEDLRKIYGMTESAYQRLVPYLTLAAPSEVQASEDKPPRIDINRATSEEWASLYGIGPVLSQRIVRFREKLGGFISVEQVAETYGLPDTTFAKIRPYLLASPILHQLPLNSGSAEELAAHPYLDTRQARAMVDYRSNHGPFHSAAELAGTGVMDEKAINRIIPYLDFSIDSPER